jgi:hypothetical protein
MKKRVLFAAVMLSGIFAFGQNSTSWPAVTTPLVGLNNSLQSGYVGIGIRPNSTSTLLPNFNLQLHGIVDFTATDKISGLGVNYGKTVRFGLTNLTTGLTANDGTVLRQSDLHFTIDNQENRDISLVTGGINFKLSGSLNRVFVGASIDHPDSLSRFNITSPENGLYVRTTSAGSYGIAVVVRGNSDAIFVRDANNNMVKNFKITGTGEVFARRYTTTLNNIPDYVFNPNYKLLTLEELRSYISTNKHLPNVPSANEFAETGVDLGELNRVLLEKVEELTLYILQLEERMKMLEAGK